jgi:hypothetical protein
MKIGRILVAFLCTGVVWGGALQAGDVTITYTGPGLSKSIPANTQGVLYIMPGSFVKNNVAVDLHNPKTHENRAFTYSYKPTATTMGPILFDVGPSGKGLDYKLCSSSLNGGEIPITIEVPGKKQKTLKHVIVHLNSSPDKESAYFKNSCSVEEVYE